MGIRMLHHRTTPARASTDRPARVPLPTVPDFSPGASTGRIPATVMTALRRTGEGLRRRVTRRGRAAAAPREVPARRLWADLARGYLALALTLLPVLYAHGGFGHKTLAPAQRRFQSDPASLAQLLRELATWHLPSPLLRLGIAPHSARAVDALLLTEMVDLATRLDPTMPIHMHVSEQQGEVAELRTGRLELLLEEMQGPVAVS